MKSTINERIRILCDTYSKNQSEFANTIGISTQSLSNYLNRNTKPTVDLLDAILQAYPFLNSDWLITGKGEMSRKKEEPETETITTMWQSLKESYEKTIEDLRYTVSLQRQILSGDLGKLEADEPTQREIIKLFDRKETVFLVA